MIYLPFIAVACITLVARIVVELAIANALLPEDADRDRAARFVLIANGIVHPIFVGAVVLSLSRDGWNLFLLTPFLELGSAALKAALFARVGTKPDPLVAIFTACFASVVSMLAAFIAAWVILNVMPLLMLAIQCF